MLLCVDISPGELISKVTFSLPNNSIIIVCPQMYKQEVEDLKAEFSRAEFLAKVK